jgi:hypothetical protein
MHPNFTTCEINLPSTTSIFKDLGGATRKTAEKNPPLQLLDFIVVTAWTTFNNDKQKVIITIVLDWSSKDREIEYVQNCCVRWNVGCLKKT